MTRRQAYFDAAMQILADRGFSGLTIAALCGELGVTSGSFYHHFGSWDGFVEALLRDWEDRETNELITGIRAAEHDVTARLDLIVELAAQTPHAAEAAIRSWSNNSATVAATQRRVDRVRRSFIEEVLVDLPVPSATTELLATMLVATYVGLEQLHVDDATFGAALSTMRDLLLHASDVVPATSTA